MKCFPVLTPPPSPFSPHNLLHTTTPPRQASGLLHYFPYPAAMLPDLHARMLGGRGGEGEGHPKEKQSMGIMFLVRYRQTGWAAS